MGVSLRSCFGIVQPGGSSGADLGHAGEIISFNPGVPLGGRAVWSEGGEKCLDIAAEAAAPTTWTQMKGCKWTDRQHGTAFCLEDFFALL